MYKAQIYIQYVNKYTVYLRLSDVLKFHGGKRLGGKCLKKFLGALVKKRLVFFLKMKQVRLRKEIFA